MTTARRELPRKRITSGVRYRDGEFEMRCPDCAESGGATCYWPLSPEFWDPHNLTACRGHLRERKRADAKRRYWLDPETERRRSLAYHDANKRVRHLKAQARWREMSEAQHQAELAYRRMRYAIRRRAQLEGTTVEHVEAVKRGPTSAERVRAYKREWQRRYRERLRAAVAA